MTTFEHSPRLTRPELDETMVGGYGKIGAKVVKRRRAFGPRVVGHDPYVQLSAEDAAAAVKLAGFERLLAAAEPVLRIC